MTSSTRKYNRIALQIRQLPPVLRMRVLTLVGMASELPDDAREALGALLALPPDSFDTIGSSLFAYEESLEAAGAGGVRLQLVRGRADR